MNVMLIDTNITALGISIHSAPPVNTIKKQNF